MSSRDEKIAAKLRAKQGDSYVSASDSNKAKAKAKRKSEPKPVVPDTTSTESRSATRPPTHAEIYDQVRDTPASRQRRSDSKSAGSVDRWRRGVSDEYNR